MEPERTGAATRRRVAITKFSAANPKFACTLRQMRAAYPNVPPAELVDLMNDEIYVDANEGPAILRYPSGRLVRCGTLAEAAAEFAKLPAHHQDMTTMRVGSKVYKADEIRRFHHGPKPQ